MSGFTGLKPLSGYNSFFTLLTCQFGGFLFFLNESQMSGIRGSLLLANDDFFLAFLQSTKIAMTILAAMSIEDVMSHTGVNRNRSTTQHSDT